MRLLGGGIGRICMRELESLLNSFLGLTARRANSVRSCRITRSWTHPFRAGPFVSPENNDVKAGDNGDDDNDDGSLWVIFLSVQCGPA